MTSENELTDLHDLVGHHGNSLNNFVRAVTEKKRDIFEETHAFANVSPKKEKFRLNNVIINVSGFYNIHYKYKPNILPLS